MEENKSLEEQIAILQKQVEDYQDKIQRQEKLASIGTLSAGIAHEVQNPLNFVINFSKLSTKLLEDLEDIVDDCSDKLSEDDAEDLKDISASLKENLEKINEHGERAISIIRGILLQSRGKSGEFLPTDIVQLVHEYVWLSYHSMRANDKNFNLAIHEEYQEDIPKLMLIPQDISRAVLNIANNACYTVKERAEKEPDNYSPAFDVKVSFAQSGAEPSGQLRIDLTDNGMGMSQEVKDRLFENFFTTKPAGKGTGLGMGITRDIIVKNHQGQILVDSKEGVGTTFSFIIPAKIIR